MPCRPESPSRSSPSGEKGGGASGCAMWSAASPAWGPAVALLVERLRIRPPRALSRLHRPLYARGLAAPFGAQPVAPRRVTDGEEMTIVARRVRALVTESPQRQR